MSRMSRMGPFLRSSLCAAGGFLSAEIAVAQFNGVLRSEGGTSRYFTDDSGRAVYLTGAHTWANLVDGWLSHGVNDPAAPPFDFTAYLDTLQDRNHNFIRLWSQHMTRTDFSSESGLPAGSKIYYAAPSPWVRSGPGTANDGGARFDLTAFNQAYFDRLRARVIAARERGMYVGIVLFEGYALRRKNGALGWNHHPFHASNNINGINGDPNSDGYGSETHTLQIPEITALQQAYIRRVVDAVNDLDNVLYEISNEEGNRMGGTTARDWQYAMMDYIREYQATLPKQHPVIISCIYNADNTSANNSWLTGSTADGIAPYGATTLKDNPPATPGGKVYFADTDHIWGVGGSADWAWKVFLRGYNSLYMDPWGNPDYPHPARTETNAAMGHTLTFARRMDLMAMAPRTDLSSTAYALASPGSEYLFYQPGNGAFTVTLTAGTYVFEWFNPGTGATAAMGTLAGTGSAQSVAAPFSGPAVLHLVAVAADQVALPSFSHEGGVFTDSVSVTLTCSTAGAEIRYTTDGSEPTETSARYTAPVTLTATTTLRARGFAADRTPSHIRTAVFTRVQSSGAVVDDTFDNDEIATNPNGIGSGWNPGVFNGGQAPAETGGAFVGAMGTENGISAIQGRDVFTVWDEAGATVTWTIRSMTVNTPHKFGHSFAYCWEMGIVSANAGNAGTAWNMSGPNKLGGFYIQIGKKDGGNQAELWITATNKTNTGDHTSSGFYTPTQTSTSPGGIGRVFTVSFPVVVTANFTRNGWRVTTNQTGLAPIEGNWTTSLQATGKDASITDEFANGVFLFTAARNHGIDGSGKSFTANTGEMDRVTVTRGDPLPAVATPVITPEGGEFLEAVQVSLSCATPEAVIRYTTDGAEPTLTSTAYAAPFTLSATTIVKARAFRSDHADSPTASATFTRTDPGRGPWGEEPAKLPGRIEAEDFDRGGEGVAYHDTTAANQGGQYRPAEGVDIESIPGGGFMLGFVKPGEWVEYTVRVARSGPYTLDLRVANAGTGGKLHVRFDGVDRSGSLTVPNTGSWTVFQTLRVPEVQLSAGTQVMRLNFDTASNAAGAGVANVDYIEMIWAGAPAQTPVLSTPVMDFNLETAVLRWASTEGFTYTVHHSPDLKAGFTALEAGIPATPPENTYDAPITDGPMNFWRVTTDE